MAVHARSTGVAPWLGVGFQFGLGLCVCLGLGLGLGLGGCKITTSGLRVSHSSGASPGTTSSGTTSSGASPGTTSSGTTSSGTTSSGTTSSGTSAPSAAPSEQSDESREMGPLRIITREQLATLRGLTLDVARQRLRALGHHGRVLVQSSGTNYDCRPDIVCVADPSGGVGTDGEVTLRMGPKLEIAPPPP